MEHCLLLVVVLAIGGVVGSKILVVVVVVVVGKITGYEKEFKRPPRLYTHYDVG